jgi:hypothetical protein
MPSDPLRWYDPNADNPPWIKALAEVRMLACREGWCYQHVQAIIVSIDQYAESALGNRIILAACTATSFKRLTIGNRARPAAFAFHDRDAADND